MRERNGVVPYHVWCEDGKVDITAEFTASDMKAKMKSEPPTGTCSASSTCAIVSKCSRVVVITGILPLVSIPSMVRPVDIKR